MNYSDTIQYLYNQLPMYQRSGPAAYKDSLDNTLALDKMFRYPHQQFKSIHVAGTNGKGSVAHSIASVLQSAGYKVGLYTSPHLKDYRERIRINGQMIAESDVVDFVQRFRERNEKAGIEPSFFELSVLMAFDYFAKEKVDFAVIEVGLGGRLDSTNVITPEVSVITNISLDHTALLGDSVEKIAVEKAGIVKKGVPVVVGESDDKTEPVFQTKAREMEAPIIFADQTYLPIDKADGTIDLSNECSIVFRGIEPVSATRYQLKNLVTTFAAIKVLIEKGTVITDIAVREGIKNTIENTGLLGRWQNIQNQPKVICDTGHNEAGIKLVVEQLRKENFKKLHVVFGTVNDKNISDILGLLPKDAIYYFTQAQIDRALDAKQLLHEAVKFDLKGTVYSTVKEALDSALHHANEDDLVFVGGSTFVVAEVV